MRAIIDRFEGSSAVVLFGDEELEVVFPRVLLPDGTGEGDWLKVVIEQDLDGRVKQEKRVSSLLDKLKKKD